MAVWKSKNVSEAGVSMEKTGSTAASERRMVATLKDHPACVEALLPHSDVRAVDGDGASALIYACQHMRLACAKVLVVTSDFEQTDSDGLRAIDHAKGWGDTELFGLLESCRLAQREARELAEAASAGGQSTSPSRL